MVNDQSPAWGPWSPVVTRHTALSPVKAWPPPAPHSAPARPRQIGLITPTSSRAEQIEKWIIAKIACFQDLCQSKLTLGQCRGLMGTFKLILWPLSELMANAVPSTSTQSSDPISTPIIVKCIYLENTGYCFFIRSGGLAPWQWKCANCPNPRLSSIHHPLSPLPPPPVSHGISSGDGSVIISDQG